MSQEILQPDELFTSEFGKGDLATRLWNGGLRLNHNTYAIQSTTRFLSNALKEGLEIGANNTSINKIINDIETCWNDAARTKRACQVLTNDNIDHSVLSVSLAKLFLSIDLFQPPMVTCIVNKISELGDESNKNEEIANLLLNQLRWLDSIVDGSALCESLLSIVPVVSRYMQKNIIEALPEIIDDSSRDYAVSELIKFVDESPSMMGSVVDAFSALGVDDERISDVNSSILSSLAAATRDTLSVSLKFLLRTCPPPLMTPTVNAMRNNLALPSLGPAIGRLCFDSVRSGLRFSKVAADHTIKILRNIEKPSEHKPADLWIILALTDSPTHKKVTQIMFRRKASNRCFSRAVMDAAFAPFVDAFYGLTDRLIELASVIFKSNDVGARRTAIELCAVLFRLFSQGNTRRTLVTSLLDHAGTRRESEVDAALDALVMIAIENESDRSLLPHSAYIQGLLDFVEFFSEYQLRQIWTILAYLCRASTRKRPIREGQSSNEGQKENGIHNDTDYDRSDSELAMLEILLRKELTHPKIFYRRIGVLGACTMLKVLGNEVSNNILEMVLEIGRYQPFTQALAFDELAQVFSCHDPVNKDTADSIRKRISVLFERRYITDREGLGNLVKDEALLPATYFGNLEGEHAEFCFSISSIIRNEKSLVESQDVIRSMIPSLRLLCVLTANRYDGSLSEVDAIIGAPLHVPSLTPDQDLDSITMKGKHDLLLSLFVAHGWFVELINAFSTQESAELRAKCIRRVDSLLEIRSQISNCVPHVPRWESVIFDSYNGINSDNVHLPSQQPASKGKKRGRPGKDGASASSEGARTNTDWLKYARQLDYKALSLIRLTTPVTWRMTETESELTREGAPTLETVIMSTTGLHFLLKELLSQTSTLVGNRFQNQSTFTVVVEQTLAAGMKKTSDRYRASDVNSTSCLQSFEKLKLSLTALGPQLARCFSRVFPNEDEEDTPDELEIELYKRCITLCLRCIAIVLNSTALSDAMAQELLFDILASLRLDGQPPALPSDPFCDTDIYAVAKMTIEQYRKKFSEILRLDEDPQEQSAGFRRPAKLDMTCCCAFLSVMESILMHCSEKQKVLHGEKLSIMAMVVLKYPWDLATLKNRKIQRMLPGIVRIYIQNHCNPLEVAETLRIHVTKEFEKISKSVQNNAGQEEEKTQIPTLSQGHGIGTLTQHTSLSYAVAVLEQYLILFKGFSPSSFKRPEEALDMMISLIRAELPLYSLGKLNHKILGPIMRAGKTLVEVFLKVFLPFLKQQFKEHRGTVVQICKMHQKPTRLLQTYCAYSKSIRDTSLTGLVPPLRKILELLLYRVKDLLQANDAMDAFQMGNLKNRDINGEVLSSQHFQYNSESDGGSEYNSQEATDEDNDEQETRAERSQGKLKKEKIRKVPDVKITSQTRKRSCDAPVVDLVLNEEGEEPQALDFGSDGSISEEENRVRRKKKQNSRSGVKRGTFAVPKHRNPGRKRAKVQNRNPLFEDEAEVADVYEEDEEEEDTGEVLSQFIVFGDEEEEE